VRNIVEMLKKTTEMYPNKVAFRFLDNSLTWKEAYSQAQIICDRLKNKGIQRGEVVAILTEHSPSQVISIFGVAMANAAFTIINPKLKINQTNHQLTDANVRIVIGQEKLFHQFIACFENKDYRFEYIDSMGRMTGSNKNSNKEFHDCICIPTDVSNIIYTSGSTGKAKGVLIPHRTLTDGARIVSQYLNIDKNDITLSILPLSFDYGLNQIMTAVYTGATVVFHNFMFPQDLIKILIREKITGLAAVPSLWPNILNPKLLDKNIKADFPSLRYITTAGGTHEMSLLKKLTNFFKNTEIIIMYGLTESFRSTYLPFKELFKRPNSIGKAVPEVEILVLNEKGEKCNPGEKGELVHRGAFVTYGYLNNPSLNEKKFIKLYNGEGVLPEIAVRSGDIVSLDEEDFIYFHGRSDMLIKCSGYRISPDEVKGHVMQFPEIKNCAVFGLKDAIVGETVNIAYESISNHPVKETELRRLLAELLPSYAIPRTIKFYTNMPLNPNGKIDFSLLIKNQLN
jgi:acyl-CoA synthetase (AMP-forming)/AMP-acid ligase II